MSDGSGGRSGVMLTVIRVWFPVMIAIVGAVGIVLGHARTPLAGAGMGLVVIALIVWMLNWMFRMSVESNRDRESEERAREYFDDHGHWPGEGGR